VAGDRITKINGKTTEGMNSTEAAKHIRGNPETTVTLTVVRKLTGKTEDVPIVRAEIRIPTVKGVGFVDAEKKVGYVRLLQFQEDSWDKLRDGIDRLKADGMKALILDLRFNGGGLLVQAEKIADLFISEGVIVETKGRLPEANSKVEARKDDTYPYFPMVVLVNEGTASASEIVAGALQDHRRAILIGGKTYGKGSVQQYLKEDLGDGSGFKYTIARYFTPNGRWIDRKNGKDYGLAPDIAVETTAEDTLALMEHWRAVDEGKEKLSPAKDRALDKAIGTAQTMIWSFENEKK
jgi:carboxyl-terminal processing protease